MVKGHRTRIDRLERIYNGLQTTERQRSHLEEFCASPIGRLYLDVLAEREVDVRTDSTPISGATLVGDALTAFEVARDCDEPVPVDKGLTQLVQDLVPWMPQTCHIEEDGIDTRLSALLEIIDCNGRFRRDSLLLLDEFGSLASLRVLDYWLGSGWIEELEPDHFKINENTLQALEGYVEMPRRRFEFDLSCPTETNLEELLSLDGNRVLMDLVPQYDPCKILRLCSRIVTGWHLSEMP